MRDVLTTVPTRPVVIRRGRTSPQSQPSNMHRSGTVQNIRKTAVLHFGFFNLIQWFPHKIRKNNIYWGTTKSCHAIIPPKYCYGSTLLPSQVAPSTDPLRAAGAWATWRWSPAMARQSRRGLAVTPRVDWKDSWVAWWAEQPKRTWDLWSSRVNNSKNHWDVGIGISKVINGTIWCLLWPILYYIAAAFYHFASSSTFEVPFQMESKRSNVQHRLQHWSHGWNHPFFYLFGSLFLRHFLPGKPPYLKAQKIGPQEKELLTGGTKSGRCKQHRNSKTLENPQLNTYGFTMKAWRFSDWGSPKLYSLWTRNN